MGSKENGTLAARAAELREQVPAEHQPKDDLRDSLRESMRTAAAFNVLEKAAPEFAPQAKQFEALDAALPEQEPPELEDDDVDVEPDAPETKRAQDANGPSYDPDSETEARMAVSERAAELDERAHSLSVKSVMNNDHLGNTVGSGILARIQGAGDDESTPEKRREKENRKLAEYLLKKQLEKNMAWLAEQIARIDERLDEIAIERAEIAEAVAALDELDELRKDGTLDPNNPAHAALLRRAGIRPEDAGREDFVTLLEMRRRLLNEERLRLDHEEERLREQRRGYQDDLDRAREISERLERGDPAAEQEGRELNETIQGKRTLDQAAWQADEVGIRDIVEERGYSGEEQDFALSMNAASAFDDEMDFGSASFTTSFANSADPLSTDGERLATNFNAQAAATGPNGPEHEFHTGVNIAVPTRSA